MKNHLSDASATQMTIVNPPPVQEMNSGDNKDSAAPSAPAAGHADRTTMEMQAL